MEKIRQLTVSLNGRKVGTLAMHKRSFAAFEYDKDWLLEGFAISPFSLPLKKGVFVPKIDPFEGLFGVFSDSLPDGWGRLLVDRLMLAHQIDPRTLGNLERLAIVGSSGMGALEYKPEHPFTHHSNPTLDLDGLALACREILTGEYSEKLDDLFKLGGSSGGARPKILTEINGEDWIVKFPSSVDGKNIGRQEQAYALCAKACGIDMAETRLFESEICDGYFGTKRFDRDAKKKKIHMASVSGLLETTHRIPNLDYNILMKLTLELTKEFSEIEKMFRLMCFNVFAHNRDDHSKNFSYLFCENERRWKLSPAYDLTHSYSLGGEHATTVNGNGRNPGRKELLAVAKNVKFDAKQAKLIMAEIEDCVENQLGEFLGKSRISGS